METGELNRSSVRSGDRWRRAGQGSEKHRKRRADPYRFQLVLGHPGDGEDAGSNDENHVHQQIHGQVVQLNWLILRSELVVLQDFGYECAERSPKSRLAFTHCPNVMNCRTMWANWGGAKSWTK